jgi:hypothetical protein
MKSLSPVRSTPSRRSGTHCGRPLQSPPYRQGQLPPLGIARAEVSPEQRRSQVALVQLTEQEPVQVMWQVELPLHETLPLAPTVAVHVELPVQSTLQESRQAPLQSV